MHSPWHKVSRPSLVLIHFHCLASCTKPQSSTSYSHVLQRTHRPPAAPSPGTPGWWPASRWQRTARSWWSHSQQPGTGKLGLLSHPLSASSEPFQMGLCQPEAPHAVWEQQMGWAHPSTRLPWLSRRRQASTGENLCASAEQGTWGMGHRAAPSMGDGSRELLPIYSACLAPTEWPPAFQWTRRLL